MTSYSGIHYTFADFGTWGIGGTWYPLIP